MKVCHQIVGLKATAQLFKNQCAAFTFRISSKQRRRFAHILSVTTVSSLGYNLRDR